MKQFTNQNTTGFTATELQKMNEEFENETSNLDPDFDEQEIKHVASKIIEKFNLMVKDTEPLNIATNRNYGKKEAEEILKQHGIESDSVFWKTDEHLKGYVTGKYLNQFINIFKNPVILEDCCGKYGEPENTIREIKKLAIKMVAQFDKLLWRDYVSEFGAGTAIAKSFENLADAIQEFKKELEKEIIDWDDFQSWLEEMAAGSKGVDSVYFASLAKSCNNMKMTPDLSTWYKNGNYKKE